MNLVSKLKSEVITAHRASISQTKDALCERCPIWNFISTLMVVAKDIDLGKFTMFMNLTANSLCSDVATTSKNPEQKLSQN